jgi:hypothetical protein
VIHNASRRSDPITRCAPSCLPPFIPASHPLWRGSSFDWGVISRRVVRGCRGRKAHEATCWRLQRSLMKWPFITSLYYYNNNYNLCASVLLLCLGVQAANFLVFCFIKRERRKVVQRYNFTIFFVSLSRGTDQMWCRRIIEKYWGNKYEQSMIKD